MRYLLFFFLVALGLKSSGAVKLVPTFENCSFYYTYSGTVVPDKSWNTDNICRVYFKKKTDQKWQKAFPPVFDNSKNEFRGSIVYLTEDTEYDFKLLLNENGSWAEKELTSFRTWTSNLPVGQVYTLADLPGYQQNKGLTISGLKGTENAWVKINGLIPLNADTTTSAQALYLIDCQYVIIEGLRITGGRNHGILINSNCSNIRIIKADISGWGRVPKDQVYLNDGSNYPGTKYKAENDATFLDAIQGNVIIDDAGIYLGEKGKRPGPQNLVIERCYIHDPNGWSNPWDGIRTLGTGKGIAYTFLHPQGPTGVYVRSNGGFVMRYNDIVGSHRNRFNDPVGGYGNSSTDGGFNKDGDIYGNLFSFGQDDGIELDGGQQNVRFYNNRIEHNLCGISTAANMVGPSYLYRNVVFNMGDSEGGKSVAVKNGGGTSYALGLTFFFNNTFYVNHACISGVGIGSDSNRELFQGYSRNNILFSTVAYASSGSKGYAIYEKYPHANNSFDYDLLSNNTQDGDKGAILVATANSEVHALKGMPSFMALDDGVFSIKSGSLGLNSGEYLKNFSDICSDSLPDMGALELGHSSLIPVRPINVEAEKYLIRMNPNGSAVVKLTVGQLEKSMPYTVYKNRDMDWLTIERSTGVANPNSVVEIRLTTSSVNAGVLKGIVIVRFENGYSVPVSIVTDSSMPLSSKNGRTEEQDAILKMAGNQIFASTREEGCLKVMDVTGKVLKSLPLSAGNHVIPVESKTGYYIISFTATNNHKCIKALLIDY